MTPPRRPTYDQLEGAIVQLRYELDAARTALAEAEAEIDRLRRALAFACKDGWSDQQGAMEHYLAMADDWTATRTQEAP